MSQSLEYRINRTRLNVKRASRRERPEAKRRLANLRRLLALHQYAALVNRARCVGIKPFPGETFDGLRGRVLLKMEFMPRTGRKSRLEWNGGVLS